MASNYPVRPPLWLHHPACLAKAVIAAVENLRDSHVQAKADSTHLALDMRVALQENMPLQLADEYLATGTTECICPEPWPGDEEEKVVLARRHYHVVPLTSTVIAGHEFPVPRD